MIKEKILILGSKPDMIIPLIDFKKIYSSNASAEIAKKYQKKINLIPHTCIVGAKNFIKIPEIQKRIISSQPDELVIRSYKDKYIKNFNDNLKKKFISNYDQIKIQSKFLNYGLCDLIFSEISYEISIYKKINYLIKCIMHDEFLGFSTGIFAALYALKENPDSQVFLSGIGFQGGDHYYGSGSMTQNRARVDRKMFNRLQKKYLDNIFIFDNEAKKGPSSNKIEFKNFININEL